MRWVIGDIHGMLRPLETLISAIDKRDSHRQLLFVGDFVNRGPESKRVIDLLLSLKQAYFVRGNHDDVFDHVLSSQSYCGEPGEDYRKQSFQWFMQHGLDKTFLSYGVTEKDLHHALHHSDTSALTALVEAVPQAHRNFIRKLPVVLESEGMFVGHAKWDVNTSPEKPPMLQQLAASHPARYALLWGRYRPDEIEEDKPWKRIGYFGHTPVDNYPGYKSLIPAQGPKIVLLDTAAALVAHGRLTAFCHETQSYLQMDVQGKPVA
jgi:serine/threonine protein phosphatase 1